MEFGLLQSEDELPLYVWNLDAWFLSIYQYWYRRGFATMVASGLTHVFTLAFTIGFSWFLFAWVDWASVWRCHDEASCGSFDEYLRDDFLKSDRREGRDVMSVFYILVFGIYWLWSCGATFWTLRDAWDVRRFFRNELGFDSERSLRAARWSDVVDRLRELQSRGRAPWRAFQTSSPSGVISPTDIALRIMRKENYLIAMLNAGVLALEFEPLENLLNGAFSLVTVWRYGEDQQQQSRPAWSRLRLTKTLEWSLHACILDHAFSSRTMTLRRAFVDDPGALKRRFLVAGVAHVVLMPFIAAFMTMRFFLMHAQEWRQQKRYLGPREWSPVSRWAFRDLNELPHVFEARLQRSKPHADAYLKLFPMPIVTTLARCVAFVAGAFVATIVAVAAVSDDAFLLYVTVDHGKRNLLWYLGLFSACFAAARTLIDDDDPAAASSSSASSSRGGSSQQQRHKGESAAAAAAAKKKKKNGSTTPSSSSSSSRHGSQQQQQKSSNNNGGLATQTPTTDLLRMENSTLDDDDDDVVSERRGAAGGEGDEKNDDAEKRRDQEDDDEEDDDDFAHESYSPAAFERAMARVADHTRCFPEEWKGKCHTHQVRDAFAWAFRYKALLFADEIASVLFAPLVLCFSLPNCAEDIASFVKTHTVEVDGVGAVLADSYPGGHQQQRTAGGVEKPQPFAPAGHVPGPHVWGPPPPAEPSRPPPPPRPESDLADFAPPPAAPPPPPPPNGDDDDDANGGYHPPPMGQVQVETNTRPGHLEMTHFDEGPFYAAEAPFPGSLGGGGGALGPGGPTSSLSSTNNPANNVISDDEFSNLTSDLPHHPHRDD